VTCTSVCPSDTVRSTFPLKCYIPEDTFTRRDSSVTLIFIWATADGPKRLYSLLPKVTVHHWIAHEFSNIMHFMEGWTFVKWHFMSHVSGVCYLLAATSIYRQDTTGSEWYKSTEKIRRFMMAGCNQQVVEDIIRSFQCVCVCLSVCLLLTAHSQQIHSPPPRDCFLLLCTIPQMCCYRSFLALQHVMGFTVIPYCSCLLILFLPFEAFFFNYVKLCSNYKYTDQAVAS
jgi:hypothetical protein